MKSLKLNPTDVLIVRCLQDYIGGRSDKQSIIYGVNCFLRVRGKAELDRRTISSRLSILDREGILARLSGEYVLSWGDLRMGTDGEYYFSILG